MNTHKIIAILRMSSPPAFWSLPSVTGFCDFASLGMTEGRVCHPAVIPRLVPNSYLSSALCLLSSAAEQAASSFPSRRRQQLFRDAGAVSGLFFHRFFQAGQQPGVMQDSGAHAEV